MDQFLAGKPDHSGKLIALGLLVFIALWISRLNTKFMLLQHRTYLPAIIYIFLVSSYLPLQQLNPAVFAAVFLVLSIEIMFDTFKKEGLALEFFMAAFLVSIASLFYARSAFLMLVVWTGLSLLRTCPVERMGIYISWIPDSVCFPVFLVLSEWTRHG